MKEVSDRDVCSLPRIHSRHVPDIVKQLYDLDVVAESLNGERDLNFKLISTRDQSEYVFKIANQIEQYNMLECQECVFDRLSLSQTILSPRIITSTKGRTIESIMGEDGTPYWCRLTTWMPGSLLSELDPLSELLLQSLGQVVADVDNQLVGFKHDALARPLLWKMDDALSVTDQYINLIEGEDKKQLVRYFQSLFEQKVTHNATNLRRSVIHNDANDNNVIVDDSDMFEQKVIGLIDYGDMVESWLVTDLAIACAYAMLDQPRPLDTAVSIVRGYNQKLPIQEIELEALFPMIAMRLCMSVSICAYQKSIEPDNKYLGISEQPAWRLLERLREIPSHFAWYAFREACEMDPVPGAEALSQWLENQSCQSIVNIDLKAAPLLLLDTSVSSPHIEAGTDKYDPHNMTRDLFRAIEDSGALAAIGRYDEYRLIYASDDFVDFSGHQRTLHLGIDVFQDAGSPIFAPLEGVVYAISSNEQRFDYGGCVILKHRWNSSETTAENTFYTLYGHLSTDSLSHLQQGSVIQSGDYLGAMGNIEENGQWPPHVHFEIITDMLNETETYVGVGSHQYRNVWLGLCPNPNSILKIPERVLSQPLSDAGCDPRYLTSRRKKYLTPSLSLSYQQPISVSRGVGQYLYDYTGRRFLDAVNNVPHVGHCHPAVSEAVGQSSRVLATNTRYLYRQLTDYAERLLAKFPSPLSVVFLVNSGSEANDLAMRLARSYTEGSQFFMLDHAYHGNLETLIGVSPYKHDGPGGYGAPGWAHKLQMPDVYRQLDQRCPEAEQILVQELVGPLEKAIASLDRDNHCAGFIGESILGCGGQVELPQGYLSAVYEKIRTAGGVCIADEVQTGFGRIGSHFWAFEPHNVIPDIVTIGKPAGNGHPLGAVITTAEIAEKFNNGMEYFNTFGGNPVSCSAGLAVLNVIEQEQLQSNALSTGSFLISQLRQLTPTYPIIGDVRGAGLFVGVDLVLDKNSKRPATAQAKYIAERMKQEGILLSTDGPQHNVLKIKPPLVFTRENAQELVETLSKVFGEKWAQPR